MIPNEQPNFRPIQSMPINWLGLYTLYVKEVRRFIKVWMQTIMAPIVTTLLFLAIFALALGPTSSLILGRPFLEFLAPGLIMMAMAQNSFANSSSSLIIAKVQGNIVDILMPPLHAVELIIGYCFGAVTRGLLVGLAVGLSMRTFVFFEIKSLWLVFFFAFQASMMLALLGIVGGIWSNKFDHIAAVTNFIVTPLSFLSGTFYSVSRLPEFWGQLSLYNPFFYMIDGFRAGFIGVSDVSVWQSGSVLVVTNIFLWLLAQRMFAKGYRLKG